MGEALLFTALVDQINEYARTGIAEMLEASAPHLAKQNEQYRSHVFMIKSIAFIEKTPLPGVNRVVSVIVYLVTSKLKSSSLSTIRVVGLGRAMNDACTCQTTITEKYASSHL